MECEWLCPVVESSEFALMREVLFNVIAIMMYKTVITVIGKTKNMKVDI